MEDRPVYSYIPKNINLTGGLFGGTVDTRRLIEGLIGVAIAYGLYNLLSGYIDSTILMYVCAILGAALFGAGIMGGNGEPISVFLFNFINYENRRIFVTLRPPMPDFDEGKSKRKEKSIENRIAELMRSKTGRKGDKRSTTHHLG